MECDHTCKENMPVCDGFVTCTSCGLIMDDRCEYLNGVDNYVEPLQICVYRRSKRFEEMLRKLTYPTPERKDDPVLEKYLKSDIRFDSIEEFLVSLKGSGIKDK